MNFFSRFFKKRRWKKKKKYDNNEISYLKALQKIIVDKKIPPLIIDPHHMTVYIFVRNKLHWDFIEDFKKGDNLWLHRDYITKYNIPKGWMISYKKLSPEMEEYILNLI
jgi:hypothetical protein